MISNLTQSNEREIHPKEAVLIANLKEVKLTLNLRSPTSDKEAGERVKQAAKAKKEASETIEEAFERIGTLKLSDKEREQFEVAKKAYFSGAIGRLHPEKRLSKGEVLTMAATVVRDQAEGLREQRIAEVLASKPDNYYILTDDGELPAFVKRVEEEVERQRQTWRDRFSMLGVDSMTAGDFEGTGIDTYIDISIGFSIWLPLLNEGYYLPYGHIPGFDVPHAFQEGDKQLTRSKVLAAISPYLSDSRHGKTFHMGDARYDLHVAIKDGYTIRGCVWDTLDAMRLMNEHEESYALKAIMQKYGKVIGVSGTVYTFEDLFGNRSPAPFNTEITGIYAINDVKYGWKLCEWQFGIMAKTDRLLECYATVDSQLPETDVFMTRCGFEIDIDYMAKLAEEFAPKVEEAKRNVFATYGIDKDFVYKMDRKINANKINAWIEAQKKRIAKRDENIEKAKAKIADIEARGKTQTKAYQQALDQLRKYEAEVLAPAAVKSAPIFVEDGEFRITNDNHIAYLIYDHLGIEDKTPRIKRGKTRSTAADVMEIYYEEEEALKPLATVATYEKLLNTYVEKIPKALDFDGRIHTRFKAGGTSTGRYSSSGYDGRPINILDEFKEGNA